jgi:hydrogenase maturation protease
MRRDDGAGWAVADAVAAAGIPGVLVVRQSGEGGALLESWRGMREVHVVDAVSARGAPGEILRIEAHREHVPADLFRYSTHAFAVAEAVELARALDELPPCVVLHGIQGSHFASGEGLSGPVAASVVEVAAMIEAELAGGAMTSG